MRRKRWITIWVLLGAVFLSMALLAATWFLFSMFKPTQREFKQSSVFEVTVIAAPSVTPIPLTATLPSPTHSATQKPTQGGGIAIGAVVQISGTGGEGLRLRSAAGTDQVSNFIGMEGEVFEVKDGPQEKNGFTWWYLQAPYDKSRSGWAAASYLSIVHTGN